MVFGYGVLGAGEAGFASLAMLDERLELWSGSFGGKDTIDGYSTSSGVEKSK